jgi:hypothetical protein
MEFNAQVQNIKREATNSDHAIELSINNQRRQIEKSNLVPIKMQQFEPRPQLLPREARNGSILYNASDPNSRPANSSKSPME